MNRRFFIASILFGRLIFSASPAASLEGTRVGDSWTDEDGTNYYGDPSSYSSSSESSSSSSDSDYHWHYTYGYNDAPARSGPSWAERMEAIREQRALAENARVRSEAVRLNAIGIEYSAKGDYDKAAEYYQKAYDTYPADDQILKNLNGVHGSQWNEAANKYYEAGDYEQAVEAYRKALELKPDSQVIRDNLSDAQALVDQQKESEARKKREEGEIAAARSRVKEKLSKFSKELSDSAGGVSDLSFKEEPSAGAARPAAGNTGTLEFKNMDSLVVDLRDAKTTVVDPRVIKGRKAITPAALLEQKPPPIESMSMRYMDEHYLDAESLRIQAKITPEEVTALLTSKEPYSPQPVLRWDYDPEIEYQYLFRKAHSLPPGAEFEPFPWNSSRYYFSTPDDDLPFLSSIPVPEPLATPDLVDLVAPDHDARPSKKSSSKQ